MAKGIPGGPIVEHESSGGYRGFGGYPELSILGKVSGNRTANVTKNVILQTLATNPARIDAVWTTGSETRVIAEAFAEAGRPQPLITGSVSGDALGYWKDHQDSFRAVAVRRRPDARHHRHRRDRGDRLWRAMRAGFQTTLEPSRSRGRNSLTKFNLIVSKSETIPSGQMVEVDG